MYVSGSSATLPRFVAGLLAMVAVSVSPSSGSLSLPRTSNVTSAPSLVLGMSGTAIGRSFTSSTVMSNVAVCVALYSSCAVTVTLYLS